jgi:recombinational DNA repair ATPase RecF
MRRVRVKKKCVVPSGPSGEKDGRGKSIMLERIYVVTYTNGQRESQTERGRLIALDHEGFVVLEVNGRYVLVPKARVDALVEVE